MLLSYLVAEQESYEVLKVLAMLVFIMILNLFSMFAAPRLVRWLGGPAIFQIVGGVLAVLQAVLGTQVLLNGLKGLGIIGPS